MRKLLATACLLIVGGCGYSPPTGVSQVAIRDVLEDIKRQVSIYYAISLTDDERNYGSRQIAACKNGTVDFDITSVKAELAVTVENTQTANAGLTLAVPAGVSIGPSFALSDDLSNAQTLTFTEFPLPSKDRLKNIAIDNEARKSAPIANTLIALRHAIIDARPTEAICFTDETPKKKGSDKKSADTADNPSNSFKLAITAVKDEKLGVTVAVLQVLSFGLSRDDKLTKANTLTVSFTQKKPEIVATTDELRKKHRVTYFSTD